MKRVEKLANIIKEAYALGIYDADELAAYIVKSGIFKMTLSQKLLQAQVLNDSGLLL